MSKTPLWAGGVLAVLLATALLAAPPMGTDLSAQVARAEFFREHGMVPVDMRWYGGTVQYGYSWLSPAIMALLGAPGTGALALVTSTVALALLLVRCAAPRPLVGSLLGAVGIAGNLVSGRVTFALGTAIGLWALVAFTLPRSGRRFDIRLACAAAGAFAASATSPVAGMFAGIVGVAIALAVADRRWDGLVFAFAAGVPLVATAVLVHDGGMMPISRSETVHSVVTGLAVAALVRIRVVRIGVLLVSAAVLCAYLIPSPVGGNATRLTMMLTLPVVAACAQLPLRATLDWGWLAPALLVLAVWQPPLVHTDLEDAGNPTADRRYFAPLLDELQHRRPIGRVEVPPTRDRWEAAYVASAVPLARGWLRQVDQERNGLFFDSSLSSDTYGAWLRDNGVSYVALPDALFSWAGRREAALVSGGLPYLAEVWRGRHWVLYEVAGHPSLVDGGTVVAATCTSVTFDAAAPGEVLVRVTPSRWLEVRGPAPVQVSAMGRWTVVRVHRPGRYVITS